MIDLLSQLSPIVLLLVFGYVLQKKSYFEEVSYDRVLHFTFNVAIPCMLFKALFTLELDLKNIKLSIAFFAYMFVLLLIGFLLKIIFKPRYKFFPFIFTSFGFGTIGLPLYITVFGEHNSSSISAFGAGHEIFIALFFLPFLQISLSGETLSVKDRIISLLKKPNIFLPLSAVFIRLVGLDWIVSQTLVGKSVFGAFEMLGNLTLTLMLILLGYRIKITDKKVFKPALLCASLRLLVTLVVGIIFFIFVIEPLTGGDLYFTHGYYILSFQHLSMALTVYVANYCPQEDSEIINTTMAINIVFSFVFTFLYLILFS